MAESCASPAPSPAWLLPHLLPKGGDCGGRVGWGWMQFQPQSRAPWLEAIFSLGPQACLPVGSQPSLPSCETAPHRPPHRPLTRTGNHTCTSWRGDGGVTAVGPGAEGVPMQSPAPPPQKKRLRARSGLLIQLLVAHFRLLHPSCPQQGERIPDPRTERGSQRPKARQSTTHSRESSQRSAVSGPSPSGAAGPGASRWALGRQPPSPSPKAAPSGGWSRAREGDRGPVRGGSVLHRHMWLDLKSY